MRYIRYRVQHRLVRLCFFLFIFIFTVFVYTRRIDIRFSRSFNSETDFNRVMLEIIRKRNFSPSVLSQYNEFANGQFKSDGKDSQKCQYPNFLPLTVPTDLDLTAKKCFDSSLQIDPFAMRDGKLILTVHSKHGIILDKLFRFQQLSKCECYGVVRKTDFKINLIDPIKIDIAKLRKDNGIVIDIDSDYLMMICKNYYNKVLVSQPLLNYRKYTSINYDEPSSIINEKREMSKPNIIFYSLDSISRHQFRSYFPKSLKKIKKLNGLDFLNHNILGDGTPAFIISLLTGRMKEDELFPEIMRTKFGNSLPVDEQLKFIFQQFHSVNYSTAFIEDYPTISTFNYAMTGFKNIPSTLYGRILFQLYEKLSSTLNCIGRRNTQEYSGFLLSDFLSHENNVRNRPVFGVSHSSFTHDFIGKDIQRADNSLKKFLNYFEKNLQKDTILFLVSDHGSRYEKVRQTQQGKQEERNPYFYLFIPPKIQEENKEILKHIRHTTVHRLITPYDMHKTLLHLIENFADKKNKKNVINPHENPSKLLFNKPNYMSENLYRKFENRGISIFQSIPPERTCIDADVNVNWCNCLKWKYLNVKNDNNTILYIGEKVEYLLNEHLKRASGLCLPLSVIHIYTLQRYSASDILIHYVAIKEIDTGERQGIEAKDIVNYYSIKIRTQPGNGLFDILIHHNIRTNEFSLDVDNISRINLYGSQSKCVANTNADLLKFCYCS
ncbi:hypothetical protein SNEBB_006113 [Seison nebaliae]|nr:hypothetical protein SNEBB_006113 [Seison nebaliae]